MEVRDSEEVSEQESEVSDPSAIVQLAQEFGLEFRPVLDDVEPPRGACLWGLFEDSWFLGKQNKVIPFAEESGRVMVAMADPMNFQAIDILQVCYGREIGICLTPAEEISRAINGVRTSLMSDRDSALESEEEESGDKISYSLKIDVTDAEDDDAPIIRYVNTLIFRAATQRASDIHVEPFENELKVRFRVDGVLQDIDTEDKRFQSPILSRIKVMANLNIAEKRLPQDGRIGLKIAGQDVDNRVSTFRLNLVSV